VEHAAAVPATRAGGTRGYDCFFGGDVATGQRRRDQRVREDDRRPRSGGRLGVPHIELDALAPRPQLEGGHRRSNCGSASRPPIAAATAGWVIDGKLWPQDRRPGAHAGRHAGLDRPAAARRPVRLCGGPWGRILRNEELWNGNRESIRTAFLIKDSLFSWTIKSYPRLRREIPEMLSRNPHLRAVRLRFATSSGAVPFDREQS